MVLRKLKRRNYGGKWPVSIKYQNFHTFKEGLTLLCQSILETRRITHLNGSAHFIIPLSEELENSVNPAIYDHDLMKNFQLGAFDRLELYISFSSIYEKATLQTYFQKLLETTNLDWKEIYILPRKVL